MAMQVVMTILVAMVILQVVNFGVLHDDRRQQAFAALRSQAVGQAAALLHLMDGADATAQLERLGTMAASNQVCVALADTVPEVSSGDRADVFLSEQLAHLVRHSDYLSIRASVLGEQVAPTYCRVQMADDPMGPPPVLLFGEMERLTFLAVGERRDAPDVVVQVALPLPPEMPILLLRDAALATGVIAVVTILMLRRVTRPLKALADAAQRLGHGVASPRLAETGPREVALAARAFNDMQESLTRFVGDRTRMLAAISHDLRTPLTSLRLRAEFVEDQENRDKICELVDELRGMVDATLDFAASEASTEPTVIVDLEALIAGIVDDGRARGANVEIVGESTGGLEYVCRPLALKRAVTNLIDNAIRYAGSASVRFLPVGTQGGPEIWIEDDGPGIAPEFLEEAFQPFVTLDTARNRATSGVGLGLAICRTIVRGHGGDVTLTNRKGGGLRATLTLPPWEI